MDYSIALAFNLNFNRESFNHSRFCNFQFNEFLDPSGLESFWPGIPLAFIPYNWRIGCKIAPVLGWGALRNTFSGSLAPPVPQAPVQPLGFRPGALGGLGRCPSTKCHHTAPRSTKTGGEGGRAPPTCVPFMGSPLCVPLFQTGRTRNLDSVQILYFQRI